VLLCFFIVPRLAIVDTKLGIAADITRIATQNFLKVIVGIYVSLMELEVAHTYIIALLCVLNALRVRIDRLEILRKLGIDIVMIRVMVNEELAFGGI
jgi:hypothetical protein